MVMSRFISYFKKRMFTVDSAAGIFDEVRHCSKENLMKQTTNTIFCQELFLLPLSQLAFFFLSTSRIYHSFTNILHYAGDMIVPMGLKNGTFKSGTELKCAIESRSQINVQSTRYRSMYCLIFLD